jgi:formate dehydrogenase accessory protein FdhE
VEALRHALLIGGQDHRVRSRREIAHARMMHAMPDVWQLRISRAEALAASDTAASPLLAFYAELLRIQHRAYSRLRANSHGAASGALERDLPAMRSEWRPALQAIARVAPQALAAEGQQLCDRGEAAIEEALLSYWYAPSDRQFYPKALLQPYAQWLAEAGVAPRGRELARTDNRCPFCGGVPQLSVLHAADESPSGGGGRKLQCATCCTEWPVRRVLCVHCGEEDERKLGYFHSPAFDHLRVDACDACRHYLKSVDLTRLGVAVPLVDEVAGAPLDIWARDHGYTKIELNLVGL